MVLMEELLLFGGGGLFCFLLFCFVCHALFCFVCHVLFCFVLFCFVLFVMFCFVLFCFVLFLSCFACTKNNRQLRNVVHKSTYKIIILSSLTKVLFIGM